MGHWARGDQELTTTVDKLRVVRGPVPEDWLAPQVQVNLGELEEDLDDYRLGQMRGLATQREAPRSPAPDSEGDICMEPEPRGPPTKGAQRRALLADALLRRGASFCHIRQLSLPWQGSKGAAPEEAEGELAEKKEKEPEAPSGTGEAPSVEEM